LRLLGPVILALQDPAAAPSETAPRTDIISLVANADLVVQLVLATLLFFSAMSWGIVIFKQRQLKRATRQTAQFLEQADLAEWVQPVAAPLVARKLGDREFQWYDLDPLLAGLSEKIDLLFIDGLHDRINVERDFRHFEPFLGEEAIVLFHDYASYYPGVRAFVDALTAGAWRVGAAAASMRLLQRR